MHINIYTYIYIYIYIEYDMCTHSVLCVCAGLVGVAAAAVAGGMRGVALLYFCEHLHS